MISYPQEFGGVQDLLKRWNQAQKRYEQFRTLHQEAFDYSAPNREDFNSKAEGQKRTKHIYDETAVIGRGKFANRMQAAIMPAWIEWAEFVPGSDTPEGDKEVIKKALEKATKDFFTVLSQSNFYTELTPALGDCAIGTGAIMVEEGEIGKPELLRFTCIPLHELYPEKPAGGAIDSVWRKMKVNPKHIERIWLGAELPQQLAEKAKKPACEDETLLNAMLFNDKTSTYHQFIIHEATKAILFHQQFNTKRVIVFRWSVTAGEVFGRGPIIDVLPAIKTVNKIKEFILQNAALQISGVYTGVDDGIFNPYTAQIAPGVIIPVGSNATANPSLRALERSGDLGLADFIVRDLQESIKKALFFGQLGEIQDPTKSATEMMIRQQEMLKDDGANFGRIDTELKNPLIDAITDIMASRGLWPKDTKVDGKQIAISHQSPAAKSEKLEDYQNLQVWKNDLASIMPPEMLDIYIKTEKYPKITQGLLGVTAELIRTEDEIIKKKDELMQQQAAMQQQQGAANV